MTTVSIKTKQDLTKALGDRTWKLLDTLEVVNRNDVRNLNTRTVSLVANGKKLCVALIERE